MTIIEILTQQIIESYHCSSSFAEQVIDNVRTDHALRISTFPLDIETTHVENLSDLEDEIIIEMFTWFAIWCGLEAYKILSNSQH